LYIKLSVKSRGERFKCLFGAFRKTIGLFLIAFGVGAVVALFLPLWLWVIVVAGIMMIFGFIWLFC